MNSDLGATLMFVQLPAAACFSRPTVNAESYFKSFPDSPKASAGVLLPAVATLPDVGVDDPARGSDSWTRTLGFSLDPHLRP